MAVRLVEVFAEIVAPLLGVAMLIVGGVAPTDTLVAADVTAARLLSVTRAVIEKVPAEVGVQSNVQGDAFEVPSSVAPAKKSTLSTVAGVTASGAAVNVTVEPIGAGVPGARLVTNETLGAVTFTFTTAEVAVAPFVSVARAVSAMMPEVVGVQEIELAGGRAVPITVVPARKSMRFTVAPPLPTALAVSVAVVPSAIEAPLMGEVSETVGIAAATVTDTAEEVITEPLESVTRAVSDADPVAAGVQFTE